MIKRLAKCIGKYKKHTLATPAFMVGEVAMEVMIPMLMATLIDRGIEAGNMRYIWITGGLLLAAAFISLYFGVMGGRMAAVASSGFARNMRHEMYYNIQNFAFSNIAKYSTSSIISRICCSGSPASCAISTGAMPRCFIKNLTPFIMPPPSSTARNYWAAGQTAPTAPARCI